jgi:hypothetical protein
MSVHIGFHRNTAVIQYRPTLHCVGDPWKHGISLWDLIPTYGTSKIIATSGFWAAILDSTKMQLVLGVGRRSVVLATLDNVVLAFEIEFLSVIQAKLLLLPVLGGHLGFHQDAACIRCRSTFYCVGDPWKHSISLWDRISIYYMSKIMTTSGFQSATLNFAVAFLY